MVLQKIVLLALLVACPAALAAAHDDNPPWAKPELARARSALTGLPVLYFVSTDLSPGGMALGGLDRMFGARALRAMWSEFLWVKVADQKTMDLVRANSANEIIICDPDQRELFRGVVKGAPEAQKGMEEALKKYASRPILYKKYDPDMLKQAGQANKPLIVVFADEGKDSQVVLSSLEDRMVAQITPKCEFVRFYFKKGSEEVQHWNVLSAPTLIALDGTKEEGPKATIERVTGKKSPVEVKALLLKLLKTLEKKESAEK